MGIGQASAKITRWAADNKTATALLAAGVAGAASAWWSHRQARQTERDHPPRGRFMVVDGVRLHHLERGRGMPVVFLHGNGATLEDFVVSGLFDRTAERQRALLFDRPGYGYSERPRDRRWTADTQARLLHRALRQLGADRPVLVAHSWGTQVAVAYALAFPQAVRGLVLMSGYYYPTTRADVAVFSVPAMPVVGDILRHTVSPLLGRLVLPRLEARIFAPRPVPPRFAANFPHGMTLRPGQLRAEAEESAFMVPATEILQGLYGTLEMPVAILAGADDRLIDTASQSARLYRDLPNAELRVLPGIGHMLHWAAPEAVERAIDSVVAATMPRRPAQPIAPLPVAVRGLEARGQNGSERRRRPDQGPR